MNTLSPSPDVVVNKVSALMDALATACTELVDALALSFEQVSDYGVRTVQGIYTAVKSLFADSIIIKLNQIAHLIRELKSESTTHGFAPVYVDSLIRFQHNQVMDKINTHNFFRENF